MADTSKTGPINLSVDAEDGRAGAAQVRYSRSEVLVSMDRDRPLFDDAGSDTVRALNLLRPDAAEPGSPVFESACLRDLRCRDARRRHPRCHRTRLCIRPSRTTLYNLSISSCALKISVPSGSRKSFSSPGVRTRGEWLSTGSTPATYSRNAAKKLTALRGRRRFRSLRNPNKRVRRAARQRGSGW